LFPRLKRALKGRRFDTREDIIAKSQGELRRIPKSAYQEAFASWKHRFYKCIRAGEAHFERDIL
ncbi:hypothetical protein WH47_12863, partial [Habropoda laboriosa]